MRTTNSRERPRMTLAVASLIVPGLGQILQGARDRGLGLLATFVILAGFAWWQQAPLLLVPLVALWLWGAWDVVQRERGRPSGTTLPFLLAAIVIYSVAVRVTEFKPERIVSGWPSIKPIARALVHPDLFEYPTEDRTGSIPILVPCIDPLPAPEGQATENPHLILDRPCAAMGESITLRGEGFFPNMTTEIWWQNPIGDYQRIIKDGDILVVTTDDAGTFEVTFNVPTTAVPIDRRPGPGETQTHTIEVRQHRPYGSRKPTETLTLVLDKIGETIALAFLATVLAVIFALPVSLLASRNLMTANVVTRAIYYVVRTLLNIIRSIETLMWAIIFAVWVGLGPFDGVLALFLHSVAALGKLYSEAIEAIDPGPIEAVRATGARWPQMVVYAVLPQFMPSFWSFTLYRWDINVRMSTVIGLVSNAGMGFLIVQWIRLGRYSAMATAIIAIVLVVAILDYLSAILRRRVIEGATTVVERSPLRRYGPALAGLVIFGLVFAWSWRIAEIDLVSFVRGAPEGLRMARDFLVPELITRPTEEVSLVTPLPVPCEAAAEVPSPASVDSARVVLSAPCANPGDPITIIGERLPPRTHISVRWLLPDGRYLRIQKDCCDTDSQGHFELTAPVHQLMVMQPDAAEPGGVQVTWKRVIGGPQPSDAVVRVLELSVVTLLMALLATTVGSLVAIPLSFLAARNVVGHTIVGRAIYNFFRLLFNLWRSVEPLILAVICATWLGYGPFAGALALALNNIPNLGKLFSESLEEIDHGPVEAITATGANRLQVLVYAVIPQIVPRFLAYILYQWDINIRMSTVIGYVGGGGIGQQFRLWIGLNQYGAAGVATWAIVAMVWSMDYISARVREKLT